MKKTSKARKVPVRRLALLATILAMTLGGAALAGCAGQADAESSEISATHEAGAMIMPDTYYANTETMQLNDEFAQCSGCHEGIGDFMMDGENDLLSVHAVAFGDAGDEIDCVLCHDATVNGTAMEFDELDTDGLCLGCHNIDEVADATEDWNGTGANPHRLNHGVFECTSCHTMHTDTQTYYCNKCHHFELPEGWVSPDYISDSEPFQSF